MSSCVEVASGPRRESSILDYEEMSCSCDHGEVVMVKILFEARIDMT